MLLAAKIRSLFEGRFAASVGDVKARTIDLSTGAISSVELWSAQSLLNARAHTDRTLFTFDASDTAQSHAPVLRFVPVSVKVPLPSLVNALAVAALAPLSVRSVAAAATSIEPAVLPFKV